MLLYNELVEKFDRLYCKYNSGKDANAMSILMKIQSSIHVMYEGSLGDSWLRLIKRRNYDDERIKQRRWRIRKYVRGMVDTFEGNVYLASFTFDDTSLATLSEKTRLRYIREYLNRVCDDYFASIDYGAVNGREHYHALVAIPLERLVVLFNKNKPFLAIADAWQYGFHSLRKIDNTRKDVVKSCSYAFKASNYAFKNADSDHKPFHKRRVEHWIRIRDEWDSVHCPF